MVARQNRPHRPAGVPPRRGIAPAGFRIGPAGV